MRSGFFLRGGFEGWLKGSNPNPRGGFGSPRGVPPAPLGPGNFYWPFLGWNFFVIGDPTNGGQKNSPKNGSIQIPLGGSQPLIFSFFTLGNLRILYFFINYSLHFLLSEDINYVAAFRSGLVLKDPMCFTPACCVRNLYLTLNFQFPPCCTPPLAEKKPGEGTTGGYERGS